MSELKISVDDAQARRRIRAMEVAAVNMLPVFSTIGRTIANRIRLCFRMGIDPWGSPWAALKIRRGQPLRDRDRTGLRNIISNPDSKGVTIGTAAQGKIARTHQFGAVIVPKEKKFLVFPGPGGRLIFAKKVTIPRRSFLPLRTFGGDVDLPPAWSLDVTRALRAYFVDAANKG